MLLFVRGEDQTTPAGKSSEQANSTHFISQTVAVIGFFLFCCFCFVLFLLGRFRVPQQAHYA